MFDPSQFTKKRKLADEAKQSAARIKSWVSEMCEGFKEHVEAVSVQEIQCNDPVCSPVDTLIILFWTKEGQTEGKAETKAAIPAEMREVLKEDVADLMPRLMQEYEEAEEEEYACFEDITCAGQDKYLECGKMLGNTVDALDEDDRVGFLQRLKAWIEDDLPVCVGVDETARARRFRPASHL